MNDIFFACRDCKVFADAGYRWAHLELVETGSVAHGNVVVANDVLTAHSFWNPPPESDSEWLLTGAFPLLKQFLASHCDHCIIFGDSETVTNGDYGLDWFDVGYLPEYGPRYFAEILGLTAWSKVREFVATADRKLWWWQENHDNIHESARSVLLQFVNQSQSTGS